MAEKKPKRFITTYTQELGTIQIIVDTQTGVNYLYTGEGLTVLVDENGKPIVTVPDQKN